MRISVPVLIALSSLLTAVSTPLAAQVPPTMKQLHEFRATGAPTYIVETTPGKFFGLAELTPLLFSIDLVGSYRPIYTFPTNPPTIASAFFPAVNGLTDGYATSENTGTLNEVYSIGPKGAFTAYPFPMGQGSLSIGPIQSPDGRLFAVQGKTVGTRTAFTLVSLNLQGVPTVIHAFTASEGYPENASLVAGQDGNIYGVSTVINGANAGVYRITPAGVFSWVARFSTGYYFINYPEVLMQASNGNLYGTLPGGGTAHAGSVYEVTMAGVYRTVYEFSKLQVGIPTSLLQAGDGQIYGTARGEFAQGDNGYSSIFKLDPSTGTFSTIWTFNGAKVLYGQCPCQLIQGSDGILYGTGTTGGTYNNGTVFALDAGLAPPTPTLQTFTPASAAPGANVLLFGNNLLAASAVSFNGTPAASFTVGSVQAVSAVVPAGATSGPVTITTPNGTFTSTLNFVVQ